MATNNNFSVLPFYGSIEEQNARKWWVYDKIYPLFTPSGFLPSFQIMMPNEQRVDTFSNASSHWEPTAPHPTRTRPTRIGGKEYKMNNIILGLEDFSPNLDYSILKFDAPYFYFYAQDDAEISIRTADGAYIQRIEFVGWTPETQGGLIPYAPGEMDNVNGVFTPIDKNNIFYFSVHSGINFNSIVVTYADTAVLRDSEGNVVSDITDALEGATYYKVVGDSGILVYNNDRVLGSLDSGQYYIDMMYNGYRFYSDIFTVLDDISKCLKLEWWNNDDFVMDAGTIVYKNPDFRNVLYLCSDIAKPEYDFSDEVVERDGYTFPVVQISKKIYRFSFWASEYLLDVTRLIRMADNIIITKDGKTYDKIDSFLLTPDWEKEGDIASVDVEFTTDTVAKKNGNTYII